MKKEIKNELAILAHCNDYFNFGKILLDFQLII